MIGMTKREGAVAARRRGGALTFALVLAVSASLMVLLAVGYAAVPARAATTTSFTVDRTDDDASVSATACTSAPNDCSLRGAIQDANAANGSGTIDFDPSLTQSGDASINLSTVGDTSFGPSALVVTSQIEIDGPTGENGITIARSSSASNFRLFYVKGSTSNLVLKNLTLSGGLAQGGDGGGGGGGAAGLGGAIFNEGGLSVEGSTLFGNKAQGGSVGGFGGVGGNGASNGGSGNGGGYGVGGGLGGAIFNRQGTVTLTNNTLSANAATGGNGVGGGLGGVIFNLNGTLTAQSSTFADNAVSAGSGGGGNVAGGVYSLQQSGAATTLDLSNDILANSSGGTDCEKNGGTPTGNNLIENNAGCAGGKVTSDPMLGPLQDNGGPTDTQALQPGSPAIDAGDNAICPATDQRGVPVRRDQVATSAPTS